MFYYVGELQVDTVLSNFDGALQFVNAGAPSYAQSITMQVGWMVSGSPVSLSYHY